MPATLQLLKTPVFIFNTLAITSGSLFGAGIASFLAKILQLKFGLSSFIAGIVIGMIIVPGTVGKNIAEICLLAVLMTGLTLRLPG